jgi:polyketide cyclase/dehydrase/lipid transport protein
MNRIFVRNERVIQAKPTEIFHILTDYISEHPRILPAHFLDYRVERGGQGHGTVISYRLHAAGRERPYTMRVEETIKGQVLTERDTNSSLVTRWSVVPIEQGQASKVSIESDWQGSSGIGGFFERLFAPLGLHKIYHEILTTLAQLVQKPEPSQPKIMLADKKQLSLNVRAMMVALGAALGVMVSLRYWRDHLRHKPDCKMGCGVKLAYLS